jgi:predicted alpha/beta hydrolase
MNDRNAEAEIHFTAVDGYRLAATLHRPPAKTGKGLVLIASATAVPRQYYGKFAAYLVERGFSVITFDYRGIGDSRPASLRGFECRMRDWAALDITAAVDFALREANGEPLLYVGHSYGGQGLGLLPNNQKVSRALFVAAQVGYWKLFPAPEKYRVYMMLNFFGPAAAHLFGYVPGKLGIGEDLPKGVFLEWAGWCMKPNYLFDDKTLDARKNFSNYHGALRGIGMTDDDWAPPVAVGKLLEGYTGTKPEHVTIRPTDIGVNKLGHFGFFREVGRGKLWPAAADWLSQT